MKRTFLLAALSIFLTSSANAKIVASCGAMTGLSYFLSEGKWSEDGISSGRFIFDQGEDEKWTVYFQDSTGQLKNTKDDGGVVIPISRGRDNEFMLAVAYPGHKQFEVYSLVKKPNGERKLFYTMNRNVEISGNNFAKVSSFTANCEQ